MTRFEEAEGARLRLQPQSSQGLSILSGVKIAQVAVIREP